MSGYKNGEPIGRYIKDVFRNVIKRTIIHQRALGTQKEQTSPQKETQYHFKVPSIPVFWMKCLLMIVKRVGLGSQTQHHYVAHHTAYIIPFLKMFQTTLQGNKVKAI